MVAYGLDISGYNREVAVLLRCKHMELCHTELKLGGGNSELAVLQNDL